MPAKAVPTPENFAAFEAKMKGLGFRRTTHAETAASLRRFNLCAVRGQKGGREVGFAYAANGLEVWIWTTWISRAQTIRTSDQAWALIAEPGERKPRYFARPMNRTKNFLWRLGMRAEVTQWKVIHRPACKKCGAPMEITVGEHLKDRYWLCGNTKNHADHRSSSRYWDDVGLPDYLQKFVDDERLQYAANDAKALAQGKQPHAAMLARAKNPKWQTCTKPPTPDTSGQI